ncbi:hypothetical protein HF888_05260 [Bermanella marisrubri]|uniref:Uncharacterized protein n=1 Tax=Bermanella marisrubri TaxID=207949 RepID=Q1N1T8_9GAMM|nr:hypothetical protein [Bermanella marisrubri]EAT12193.1 hypothetical protein RED65_04185 [Oceanobacter sp. RED65] [Bermanella marisrubri]QIZ83666.1 hypothetical protein HF888_05260 [Bermanella marisrubri]
MMFALHTLFARYYAWQVKKQYRARHFQECLRCIQHLEYWDCRYTQQPLYTGYRAMCHYQTEQWENITAEIEQALFVLRRSAQEDKQCFLLWQELKSHLADLRYIERHQSNLRKVEGL